MTTTINADTVVGGAVITGDTSGELGLQAAGSTKLTVAASGVSLATPLPIASGGTGSSSTTFANLTTNVTGTLPVANGGTGATTLTSNNVILGNGTSAVQFVAPGTNGNILTSNGTTWTSAAAPSSIPNITVSNRTSNTILGASDKGTLINVTSGTFTQTITAAATLGSGWWCYIANVGTGTVTVDPNGSETIGGVTTATLYPGCYWLIICNGTNFILERISGNNLVILTSGSTYTVEAGVYKIDVELWGGGGSGGKDASNQGRASGGGSGGYVRTNLNVTPGQSISYGIGAGGTSVSSSGAAGNAGGNTTFSTLTASGGSGGTYYTVSTSNTTATGGSASGGDINVTGNAGWSIANSSQNQTLSFGGSAPNGGAGGTLSVIGTVQAPGIPGGGGAGTHTGITANSGNSQAGERGEIRIRFV